MLHHTFDQLPVIRNEEFAGLITQRHLLSLIATKSCTFEDLVTKGFPIISIIMTRNGFMRG